MYLPFEKIRRKGEGKVEDKGENKKKREEDLTLNAVPNCIS